MYQLNLCDVKMLKTVKQLIEANILLLLFTFLTLKYQYHYWPKKSSISGEPIKSQCSYQIDLEKHQTVVYTNKTEINQFRLISNKLANKVKFKKPNILIFLHWSWRPKQSSKESEYSIHIYQVRT